MPRLPLDDECRVSPLRRVRVPVPPFFANVRNPAHSYCYLDRSCARDRLRIISRVDRPFSLRVKSLSAISVLEAPNVSVAAVRLPRHSTRSRRQNISHCPQFKTLGSHWKRFGHFRSNPCLEPSALDRTRRLSAAGEGPAVSSGRSVKT